MLVTYFIFILMGIHLSYACDMDQTRRGCRIQNRMCSCGFGCISEYRYETLSQCQNALKGKRGDSCYPNPCLHAGSCLQISQQPGYRCSCEGTGYFGARCNRACPVPGSSTAGNVVFPHECVEI